LFGQGNTFQVERKTTYLALASLVWLFASAFGLVQLLGYELSPGSIGRAPPQWPLTSAVHPAGGYTLIVSIHPQCPCTRATVEELARLMARCPKLEAKLLFLKPKDYSQNWVETDIWSRAGKIPRVTCLVDESGTQISQFHSDTSGEAILYDSQGDLAFHGGITAGRGHIGDNAGVDSIIAIVSHHGAIGKQTPVYGCPIFLKARPR
jgi:hypothetical protein